MVRCGAPQWVGEGRTIRAMQARAAHARRTGCRGVHKLQWFAPPHAQVKPKPPSSFLRSKSLQVIDGTARHTCNTNMKG